MDSHKIISIITVTYNCVNIVESTIQSILEQNNELLEYIIIDGQSNDGTIDIINQYNHQIDYFISEPDKGIYDAMNKGLKAATGEYVLFINAGDLLYNTSTIANLMEIINEQAPDVLYGETLLIDGDGNELGTRSNNSSRKLPEQLNLKSLSRGMVVSHQSFLVKRTLAPNYDLQYSSSADVDWVIKCLKQAQKVVNAHQIISRYLTGGYSKQTLRTSLGERFKIFTTHYGLIPNLTNHLIITLRAIWYKFNRKELN
ncbi:MAG: glycosyltransferase family 2 protein [Chitinophagales bacterium]